MDSVLTSIYTVFFKIKAVEPFVYNKSRNSLQIECRNEACKETTGGLSKKSPFSLHSTSVMQSFSYMHLTVTGKQVVTVEYATW